MTDAHLTNLIAAGNAMRSALNCLPCRCSHNVPYAGSKVERKVTVECARCVSMLVWDEANNNTKGEQK